MKTLNPTDIEWCRNADGTPGYTLNPVKGMCPVDCKNQDGKPYCYARRIYRWLKLDPRSAMMKNGTRA